jgi:crotonobetainyl-CoA:carnitine CoA-transferase CaiB-like acyl-CoA transferase
VRQALSDVVVVEIGSGYSSSWCAKVFADLGADVVKVEPPEGDPMRADRGAFANLGTNKRSVVLDGSEAGRAELLVLLDAADLVVEGSESGSLASWGLDRDQLMNERPALSVVAISGFGLDGPYASYRTSDLVAQAFAGSLVADQRGPVKFPMRVAECAVGHTAAVGALGAVLRARATGSGALIDCATVEAVASNPLRMTRHLGWRYSGGEPLVQQVADSSTTLLPLGAFPCADGYVAMMMTPQQLSEMLDVIDSDELRSFFALPDAFSRPEAKEVLDAALYPWLLDRTRQEITEVAQRAGWPVAPIQLPGEVFAADHLHQRGFWMPTIGGEAGEVLVPGAPYRFTEGGWKLRRGAPLLGQAEEPTGATHGDVPHAPAAASADPDVPPLTGLRVLDLSTVWSGPLLTMQLADLGAEVIRVESPRVFPPSTKGYSPRPDPSTLLSSILGGYGPAAPDRPDRPYNRHSMNNSVSRGKRSVTLDVRAPEQRALFFELVARSDVFVENLKSTTLHQMGIHETEMLKVNPRLIILRTPPAGLSGDWSSYTGFGGQFDGLSGFASLCGHRGTELYETPTTQYMDGVTGPAGAFAVLAALHYRAATGRGQVIELAQSENVIAQLGDVFIDLQLGVEPKRYGNRDPRMAPQGLYPCADDHLLALTVPDDDAWRALASAIGRADLGDDEHLAGAPGRQAAHDEIDGAIAAWTSSVGSSEAFHLLQAAGVPAAPYLDEAEFAADPQIVARGWIQPLASTDVGTFDHFGHAYRGIPLSWERGAPVLGEDNEYVLTQIVGLDDEEYRRLVDEGVAIEDYLDGEGRPV